jgi:ATP synthase protein I
MGRRLDMGFRLKNHRSWVVNLTLVLQLGLTMVGSILLCFIIGRTLDKWLNTRGIFLIIFTIAGVVGGAVTAYRQILETMDDEKTSADDTK